MKIIPSRSMWDEWAGLGLRRPGGRIVLLVIVSWECWSSEATGAIMLCSVRRSVRLKAWTLFLPYLAISVGDPFQ